MEVTKKIDEFIKECGVFFLATTDGDQPKCRPLGVCTLIDGQLYFSVGDFKDVYKQLKNNPKVEVNACKGYSWLRLYGTAVFDEGHPLADELAKALPAVYNEETGYKIAIFHLENATAEFKSGMEVEESYNL